MPNVPWITEAIAGLYRELYSHAKFLQQAAIDDFIEKNKNALNANDLLAPPRGMQYAGEHFHNSQKEPKGTSRLYLPVAPHLLEEFRALLQDRDYLHKQRKDVWMYLTICESHARSDEDLCKLTPESVHSHLLSYWSPRDFEVTCALTDLKAEALKLQYATYYEALLCRLADNLFLEVA